MTAGDWPYWPYGTTANATVYYYEYPISNHQPIKQNPQPKNHCTYCGRRESIDKDCCPGCGAPYMF